MIFSLLLNMQSHPVWVCGLKQFNEMTLQGNVMSHPVWVCGLKPFVKLTDIYNGESHPVWVCGLKLKRLHFCSNLPQVTPCMGVWIETFCVKGVLL